MLAENLRELREEASLAGVAWSDVVAQKSELVRLQRERRWASDAVRYRSWELFCLYNGRSAGCQPFWRCGFDHVRRRLENSGRDFTTMRGYDVVFTGIASEFPEWVERSADELFSWLFEPYVAWPARESFYWQALELVAGDPSAEADSPGEVVF